MKHASVLALSAWLAAAPLTAEDRPGRRTLAVEYPGAAKRNQCLFLHDGHLYVFGGTRSLDPRDFSPENFVDDAYRVEVATGRVEPLAKPPAPMMRVNTVVADEAGYAVGGITHDGTRWQLSDAVRRYDFDADRWTELPVKLPTARTLFGLAERDGTLWVLGGWAADPERADAVRGPGLRVTDEVLTIDIKADPPTLTVRPEKLPNDRRSYGGARLGEKFYLTGGLDDGFDYVEKSETFDLAAREWGPFPSPSRARAMGELAAHDGKLYLAGGFSFGEIGDDGGAANPFAENRSLEAFDPATGRWATLIDELPHTVGGSALNMLSDGERLVLWSFDQEQPNRAYLTVVDPAELDKEGGR